MSNNSWWDFGEWSGYSGPELNLREIHCPFCMEAGNFHLTHHEEKKKQNSEKKLNFDTYKCDNCSAFILIFWTSSEFGAMHAYKMVPYPLGIPKAPEEWPDGVKRYWIQAQSNLKNENWDATSLMARSAMQIALRDKKAIGKNLKEEIEDLAIKGILPPLMKDWANELRELGNDSAHPKPDQKPTDKEDAKDVVSFLNFLLEYLYSLPKQIEDYRTRKNGK